MFKNSSKLLSFIRRNSVEFRRANSTKKLGLLGVPFNKGQKQLGVEKGPKVLRKVGLNEMLKKHSPFEIRECGDLIYESADCESLPNMHNYPDFLGCSEALIERMPELLTENDEVLVIGGDHSVGFGSIAGHLRHTPNLSVVWVDAHADLNLNVTSVTGNIHGMPVSLLLKELQHYWTGVELEKLVPKCIPVREIVYIGLRDVDPREKSLIEKMGIKAFSMDVVDRCGIHNIMERTLDSINPNNKIHISFDIDALDILHAPSTGTSVAGGLTLREGKYILEALRETNRIEVIDLVEINPNLGSDTDISTTLTSALEILRSAYGHQRPGNRDAIGSLELLEL